MKLGNGIRSILRNGAYLAGSNWIEIILRAVYVVVITRLLGPESYGIWAYVMTTYIFAMSSAAFGLDALVGMSLGRSKTNAASDMAAALALRLGLLALAAIGLLVFVASGKAALDGAATAILIAVPALFARSVSELSRSMFVGIERAGLHLRVRGTMRLSEVVIGALLLSQGAGLWAILIVHALSWVAEAILCVLAFEKALGKRMAPFSVRQISEYLKRGVKLGAVAIFGAWMIAAPVLLYAPLAPQGYNFGAFSLAMQLATILVGSILGFYNAALPIVSRSVAAKDPRASAYGRLSAVLGAGFCVAAAVVAYFVGPNMVEWVFGAEFKLTGALLAPVSLLAAAIVLPAGFSQSNLVRGTVWPTFIGNVIGSAAIFLLFDMMVAQWGALGAIAGAGVGWVLRAIVIIAVSVAVLSDDGDLK